MEPAPDPLAEGARNLLLGCAGLGPGAQIVIAAEDPALGWHDAAAPEAVAAEAARLGMSARIVPVGPPDVDATALDAAAATADAVIHFARRGDHGRFAGPPGRPIRVMSYARDAAALASAFGRTPHAAMAALKTAVDAAVFAAARIEITCPLGTNLVGRAPRRGDSPPDVTIRRFPLGAPAPVPAEGFTGTVALARWLTPTGNSPYAHGVEPIPTPVLARIADGALVSLEGDPAAVAAIRAQHFRVGARFGGGVRVHSWHAGIHPGCAYPAAADDDPDRWSNTAFPNPRLLHFHTCGAEAPGEICWMIADPTIALDGAPLWRDGRLAPDAFPAVARAAAHPALAALLAAPERAIGL